jgi:hypothetical protein
VEKSDKASLLTLEEYFWGNANRFALLISKAAQCLPAGAKVLNTGTRD